MNIQSQETRQEMHDAMAASADEAAGCLRALSNPSRLLLLCQLVDGERSVGELENALDLGQAYVSQQLARLRGEGLVKAVRDGRIVRYSLADPRVVPLLQVLYEQFCNPALRAE
ncbi:metalloregulator ArsR/SmtB family transcription factor [Alphaproteobacteria bacterium GH1-50]|uniref:Metalloregulator ArsR/SmtB family transcription factor n=2 Tax=Kangsaoukella pontilimi TaxID=2691042 RepID=A0A7C9MBD8_9RHOB|nr:metalloregulator ArsR/SmtB family transcription factor [Kangsaoukella pontilimi]